MVKLLNILLLTLEDEKNLGDAVIADCTKYILNNILRQKNIKYNLTSIDFKKTCTEEIYNADLIIFSGGGLISNRYQTLTKRINEITEIADKIGTPVIFNAVGVEGYGSNLEYQILRRVLKRGCVKFISTRDDIDLLNEKYIEKNSYTKSKRVADSAVWAGEVYNINRDKLSNIVGLGIIRSHIFQDNDINFNEIQQLELWSNIIYELETKGEEWIFFTNGLERDYNFAVKVLEYMGRHSDINTKIIKRPVEAKELVKTISNFKAIIAARLHANIIAYALDIPSIGIIWNPKLDWFGEIIGVPSRFFKVENCQAQDIVNEMDKAINKGYDSKFFKKYKESTYISLKNYLTQFLNIALH